MRTTYNKFPEVYVQGYDDEAWQGWAGLGTARLGMAGLGPAGQGKAWLG